MSPRNTCEICDQGTSSTGNMSSCQQCGRGRYNTYHGSTSLDFCNNSCLLGTYGNNPAAPNCLNCPVGFWSNASGLSFCDSCGNWSTNCKIDPHLSKNVHGAKEDISQVYQTTSRHVWNVLWEHSPLPIP
jgi:hypothetical protein